MLKTIIADESISVCINWHLFDSPDKFSEKDEVDGHHHSKCL